MSVCGIERRRSLSSQHSQTTYLVVIDKSGQVNFSGGAHIPLSISSGASSPASEASIRFLESAEAAHSSRDTNELVGQHLGVVLPPMRMDSQAKYCVLARGEAGAGGVYLRIPVTGAGYIEKIWVRICL